MKNRYEVDGDVTRIYIVRKNGDEYVCLIDTEDLKRVMEMGKSVRVMVVRKTVPYPIFVSGGLLLHRFILNAPQGMEVDHIDGNALNCMRSNMRVVSTASNAQNKHFAWSRPGVRGVSYTKENKYRARVGLNGKSIYLGVYETLGEASLAVKSFRKEHMEYSEMDKAALPIRRKGINPKRTDRCGVHFDKRAGKWVARVYLFGKTYYAGVWSTSEKALSAAMSRRDLLLTPPDIKEAA